MSTLFDMDTYAPSYPHLAGHQAADTSRDAAPSFESASIIRLRVLREYQERGAMTADECAERMRLSILTIRPRCTELKRLGLLRDTGKRRPNASGKMAMVLTA